MNSFVALIEASCGTAKKCEPNPWVPKADAFEIAAGAGSTLSVVSDEFVKSHREFFSVCITRQVIVVGLTPDTEEDFP
jgi:hypothetical protein